MIKKRLRDLALLVKNNEKIFDIGCDHGLLEVYLILNKHCFCRCCDVTKDIIDRAIANFKKNNVLNYVDIFVGNGFNDLNVLDATIVLAGMGTSTMLKIIEKNKGNSIICQTNTDVYELRKKMMDLGYYISNEVLTYENGRYYVSIRFEKGFKEYSYDDYLLGPVLIQKNDNLFNNYVNYLYNKLLPGYLKSRLYHNDLDQYMNTLLKYKKL